MLRAFVLLTSLLLCTGIMLLLYAEPGQAAEELVIDPGDTVTKRPRLGDIPIGTARIGATREVPNKILNIDTRSTHGWIMASIHDRGREFRIKADEAGAGQKVTITTEFEIQRYTFRRIRRGRTERHEWKRTGTFRRKYPVSVVITVGNLPRPIVAIGETMQLPLPGRAVWNGAKTKRKSRAEFSGVPGGYTIKGLKLGKISNTSLLYRIDTCEQRQPFQYEVVERPTELPPVELPLGGSITLTPGVADTLGLKHTVLLQPYKLEGPHVVNIQEQHGTLLLQGLAEGTVRCWLACVGQKRRNKYAVQCYVDVTVTVPTGTPLAPLPGRVTPGQIIDALRRHLVDGESKGELSRELNVSVEEFDSWVDKLFRDGGALFQ